MILINCPGLVKSLTINPQSSHGHLVMILELETQTGISTILETLSDRNQHDTRDSIRQELARY